MRFLVLLFFFASSVSAQPLAVTYQFANGTAADATEINQNFADIVSGVNAKLKTDNASPYNTAVGFEALTSNTAGGYNTALGWRALHNNTTGDQNTAIGREALFSNTGGLGQGNNVAIGYKAL